MAVRGGGVRQSCSPSASGRGAGSGLQPIRATVPFHLQSRDSRAAVGKPPRRQRVPCIRRTSSLDTIIVPYLLGQWPRDVDVPLTCVNDKATQTPTSWREAELEKNSCHKRSASWGSLDHRKEVAKLRLHLQRTKISSRSSREEHHSPLHGDHAVFHIMQVSSAPTAAASLLKLNPRLHRSLEGLNKELEEVFVKDQGERELLRVMDVPDGHRAPDPIQRSSSGSQSDHSPTPLEQCGTLPPSPSAIILPSPVGPSDALEQSPSPAEASVADGLETETECCSPSSPKPNHSYMFKREPPEGCERVKVVEEAISSGLDQACLPSCPDKNKVHFTPTGSAFCPVSIMKPLLPTMDFLFRNLPATPNPVTSPGAFSSCQSVAHPSFHGPGETSGMGTFSELKSQPLQREHWKRTQAEDGAFLHSSLVV